jgi:hypothetical protein
MLGHGLDSRPGKGTLGRLNVPDDVDQAGRVAGVILEYLINAGHVSPLSKVSQSVYHKSDGRRSDAEGFFRPATAAIKGLLFDFEKR